MKQLLVLAASLVILTCGCKSVSEEELIENFSTKLEAIADGCKEQIAQVESSTELDEAEVEAQIETLYDAAYDNMKSEASSLIKKHPSGAAAVHALKTTYYMYEVEELEKLLAMLKGEAAEDEFIENLHNSIAAKKATAEGEMFIDFEVVEDPEQSEVVTRFSDFVGKGKYVLVDFWASWCGPCKREIPNIAEVYKKYAGEDFDVLSVAVWDKIPDTKAAALEHGVVWSQIINALDIPTKLYGIEGIPHIMLVSPEGKIIARNLRGENIEKAVAEALGR